MLTSCCSPPLRYLIDPTQQRYDEAEARDASFILLNVLKYTHGQDIV